MEAPFEGDDDASSEEEEVERERRPPLRLEGEAAVWDNAQAGSFRRRPRTSVPCA